MGMRGGGQVKNGKSSEGSGWLRWGGEGIHRNWMSTATISIRVIRVQTVSQTGVWFCYPCSRLVPGSAVSVPESQVSGSGGNQALDKIFVFYLPFQFFARIQKGMGVGGLVGSLCFDVQRWGGGLAQFRPIRTNRKRRDKGAKI